MLRILLADDHSVVRRIVRNFVQSESGWEVCAEATTGRAEASQCGVDSAAPKTKKILAPVAPRGARGGYSPHAAPL